MLRSLARPLAAELVEFFQVNHMAALLVSAEVSFDIFKHERYAVCSRLYIIGNTFHTEDQLPAHYFVSSRR